MQKGKGFIEKLQDFLKPPALEEHGPQAKGIVMCTECHAYYYEKAWHNSLDKFLGDKDPDKFAEQEVSFASCPACKMKKARAFEGEIVIKLHDASHREDIMNTVHNSDEQARDKNPMDRVLWISDKGDAIHVFTSDNQLAVKIGKKLDSSLKGGKLDIKYGEATKVTWER